MLKNILNLDGVQELNKEQQKAVNGGKLKNCQMTGNEALMENSFGEAVGFTCEWVCDRTFLGIKTGEATVWGGCSVWG